MTPGIDDKQFRQGELEAIRTQKLNLLLEAARDLQDDVAAFNPADLVHITGTETVTGDKNFTGALQKSGVAVLTSVNDANWSGTDLAIANGGTGSSTAADARTALGLAIGTNVQAYDADLTAIATLTSAADKGIHATGAGTWATYDLSSVARTLNAQTTQALMRTTGLGLGTSAVIDTGTSGTKVALTDGANTWSAAQVFSSSAKSTSATDGLGYGTGAGGTVTQLTNKSTGVTLDKVCGQITMNGAALAGNTIVSFVVTSSACAATDTVVVNHASVGTPGNYLLWASGIGAGSFTISVRNMTAGSLSQAIVITYSIIKAVTS